MYNINVIDIHRTYISICTFCTLSALQEGLGAVKLVID